tara:strand:- start:3223 stop:4296 length:1074 start_codon:yes stop_codon:yes gene_type:complete
MHKFKNWKGLKLLKYLSFIFLFLIEINNPQIIFANTKVEESIESIKKNIQNDYYLLGPGDFISIDFIGAAELSGKFQILSDGNIQLPLLGTQSLSGLTLNQAKEKLILLFSDELIKPDLNLNLVRSRPLKISVIGEIYRPGIYSLDISDNSQGYPTVIDAIQKSGGLTFDADITKVILYRELQGENSQYKKVELNLLSMFQTGEQKYNPNLFDGDVIKISKLTDNKNSLENIANNLIPENIKVYVVGEVDKPGMYTVDSKTTVENAILIAGGPKSWRYQKNNVKLIRIQRNGEVKVKKISFKENIQSNSFRKIALRTGDIIRVNKNLFGKSSDALGTFLNPINDLYSLYGVYSLIND